MNYLILASLATFFLAQLIAVHTGPFSLFLRLRNWLKPTKAYDLFICPYCLGVYIALGFAAFSLGELTNLVLNWFAIVGAQWFLQGLAGRENDDKSESDFTEI